MEKRKIHLLEKMKTDLEPQIAEQKKRIPCYPKSARPRFEAKLHELNREQIYLENRLGKMMRHYQLENAIRNALSDYCEAYGALVRAKLSNLMCCTLPRELRDIIYEYLIYNLNLTTRIICDAGNHSKIRLDIETRRYISNMDKEVFEEFVEMWYR